jgi:hypothetical protein
MATEGERWARAELERLRFTPAGIGRFLGASWRRSAQVRRARPELARRGWSWMAAGGLLYLPARVRLRPALTWWGATAVMLDWHLGMFETEDGHARNLGAADALTLARAWLVPVALDTPSPLVCLAAAATDALDGPAARRAGPTRAGRDLEGLVDASFTAAALRGAQRRGWLDRGPVAGELARIGAGFAFAVGVWFGRAQPPPDALLHAARWSTALRVAGLVTAGSGRRRLADALLLAGSALSLGLLARVVAASSRAGSPSRAPSPASGSTS